jgi:hypothetical protein
MSNLLQELAPTVSIAFTEHLDRMQEAREEVEIHRT